MVQHETYHGDRTADALEKFIDNVADSVNENSRIARVPYTKRITLAEGCQVRSTPQ